MIKRAIPISKLIQAIAKSKGAVRAAQTAGGAAAGGGLGGLFGYYVTPPIVGYGDVPGARRTSAYSDAVAGAAVGALAANPVTRGLIRKDMTGKNFNLKKILGWAGVPVLAEIPPVMVASQTKQREAAEMTGAAARNFSDAARSMSIPQAVSDVIRSGGFRGAVAGAGVAGLGGMLSGMYRPKSRKETETDANRTEMMRSDVLRYLLPAVVAGGVIGSMRGRGGSAPAA